MDQIDRAKINPPKVQISSEAYKQIELRLIHEFAETNKFFRIHIDGKGCAGFTFGAFFTDKDKDDFLVYAENNEFEKQLPLIIEPFTAFYAQNIKLDYLFNPEDETEGFIINVQGHDQFSGKFFKEKDASLPPLVAKQILN